MSRSSTSDPIGSGEEDTTQRQAYEMYVRNIDLKSPYEVGNVLSLTYHPNGQEEAYPIRAKIMEIFRPFTNSVVVLVKVDKPRPDCPATAVIKLFDRRYATSLRKLYCSGRAWCKAAERDYARCVINFDSDKIISNFSSQHGQLGRWRWFPREGSNPRIKPGTMEDDLAPYSAGAREVICSNAIDTMFGDEVESYRRLASLQGTKIPRLYGTVTMASQVEVQSPNAEFFETNGIFIEHIPGESARSMGGNIRQGEWIRILEAATNTMKELHEHKITSNSFRTKDCILRPGLRPGSYDPVMIDFGTVELGSLNHHDVWWEFLEFKFDAKSKFCTQIAIDGSLFPSALNQFESLEDIYHAEQLRQEYGSRFNDFEAALGLHYIMPCEACEGNRCYRFERLWRIRIERFRNHLFLHQGAPCRLCIAEERYDGKGTVCSKFWESWDRRITSSSRLEPVFIWAKEVFDDFVDGTYNSAQTADQIYAIGQLTTLAERAEILWGKMWGYPMKLEWKNSAPQTHKPTQRSSSVSGAVFNYISSIFTGNRDN